MSTSQRWLKVRFWRGGVIVSTRRYSVQFSAWRNE